MPSVPESSRLDAWSEQISDKFAFAATHLSNEMELREHVHADILAALSELYGMDALASSGEFNTKASGKGRSPLDRLYGGVAVEWEWAMSGSRREHGAAQALEYLANIRRDHPSREAFTAVVADGRRWGFLRFDPTQVQADLFAVDAPETSADHFQWVENDPAAVRRFLVLIGSHRKSPITGRALATRFGPASDIAQRMVALLQQSLAGREPGDRTDTLYLEWRRALDVVYGDLDQTDSALAVAVQTAYKTPTTRPLGELLFVLHTYFALVGRLIAVELLAVATNDDEGSPTRWLPKSNSGLLSELNELERGRLPGDLQISNLFEADLFSWWSSHAISNNDLLDALRETLRKVDELAFPRLAFGPQRGADVLRDLYQTIVPSALRKALGEFLTPHWLADACLSRAKECGADLASGRVLDPTCGTGTFIVPVIAERLGKLSRGTTQPTAQEVQDVLDSVQGIDLNPVAVTATRVNYTLALGELALVGSLTLPVWRADSIVVPETAISDDVVGPIAGDGAVAGVIHSRFKTSLPEPLAIPASMETAAHIVRLREIIESALLPASESDYTDSEVEASRLVFEQEFRRHFSAGAETAISEMFVLEEELAVAKYLFDTLLQLSIEGRDGIWARIIENAYAPIFAGRFDVVIGNPPWLTWTKLPKGWRDQTERLWRRAGFWYTPAEAGDSFSLQSTDIATLVFGVALMRYAKPGGYVALLTPSALINADPGNRAFRQFRIRPDKRDRATTIDAPDVPFQAVWVDDWSKVHPFAPDAANTPIFLVTKRDAYQGDSTRGSVWRRVPKARISGAGWTETRKALVEVVGDFAPVDPNTSTSQWRFQPDGAPALITGGSNDWTFGKGLDTRGANGIYFVDVARFSPSAGAKKATVRAVNNPAEGRNLSVNETRGDVEAELVFPLLRGRDVSAWVATPSTFFVLPHEKDDWSKPIAASELRASYPKAYAWLSRHKQILKARKVPPARKWDMTEVGNDWYRVDGPIDLMVADHVVVVRELAERPPAAVVEARSMPALGNRKVAPLIDHKLLFCAVETRGEALYLAAMINSTPMQDLLASFVNATSVSPKALKRLPLPTYVADDPDTVALVSKAATIVDAVDPAATAASSIAAMDELVLRILHAAPGYAPQARRVSRVSKRMPPPDVAVQLDFDSLL